MTVAGYVGIGAGVLALVVVIQSLRLRSAKRALASAEARAADAWKASEAAERRLLEEKAVAAELQSKLDAIDAAEAEALKKVAKEKLEAKARLREVDNVTGDDDALLRVLGDELARGGGGVSEG